MQVATTIDGDTGMVVKRLSVPVGLEELMESLTKQVLMKKPKDLFAFASEHFAHLVAIREKLNANEKDLSNAAETKQLKVKSVTSGTRFNKLPTPIVFTNSKGSRGVTPKAFQSDEKRKTRFDKQSLIKDPSPRRGVTTQKERAKWKKQPPGSVKEETGTVKKTPREIREAYTFRRDDSKNRSRDRVKQDDKKDEKAKVLKSSCESSSPVKEAKEGKTRREPTRKNNGITRITPRNRSTDSSSSGNISIHGKGISKSTEKLIKSGKGKTIAKVAPIAVGTAIVDGVAGNIVDAKKDNKNKKSPASPTKTSDSNIGSESDNLSDRSDKSKASQKSTTSDRSDTSRKESNDSEQKATKEQSEEIEESVSGSVAKDVVIATTLSEDVTENDISEGAVINEDPQSQNEPNEEEAKLETIPEDSKEMKLVIAPVDTTNSKSKLDNKSDNIKDNEEKKEHLKEDETDIKTDKIDENLVKDEINQNKATSDIESQKDKIPDNKENPIKNTKEEEGEEDEPLTIDGKPMTIPDEERCMVADSQATIEPNFIEFGKNEENTNSESSQLKEIAKDIEKVEESLTELENEKQKNQIDKDSDVNGVNVNSEKKVQDDTFDQVANVVNEDIDLLINMEHKDHNALEKAINIEEVSDVENVKKELEVLENITHYNKEEKTATSEKNTVTKSTGDNSVQKEYIVKEDISETQEEIKHADEIVENQLRVLKELEQNEEPSTQDETDQKHSSADLHPSYSAPNLGLSPNENNEESQKSEKLAIIAKTPSFTDNTILSKNSPDDQFDGVSQSKVEDDGPLSIEDVSKYLNEEKQKQDQDSTERPTTSSVFGGDVEDQSLKHEEALALHVPAPLSQLTESRHEDDMNNELAAIKIQSAWRGHSSRKHIAKQIKHVDNGHENRDKEDVDEKTSKDEIDSEEKVKAATVIQAFLRGHLVRKHDKLVRGKSDEESVGHLLVKFEEKFTETDNNGQENDDQVESIEKEDHGDQISKEEADNNRDSEKLTDTIKIEDNDKNDYKKKDDNSTLLNKETDDRHDETIINQEESTHIEDDNVIKNLEAHEIVSDNMIKQMIKEDLDDLTEKQNSKSDEDVYTKLSDTIDQEIHEVLEKLEQVSIPEDDPDYHNRRKRTIDFKLEEDYNNIDEEIEAAVAQHLAKQLEKEDMEVQLNLDDIQEENEDSEEISTPHDKTIKSEEATLESVPEIPLENQDTFEDDKIISLSDSHIDMTRNFVDNEKVNYDESPQVSPKNSDQNNDGKEDNTDKGMIVGAFGAVGGFIAAKTSDLKSFLSPRSKSSKKSKKSVENVISNEIEDDKAIESVRIKLKDTPQNSEDILESKSVNEEKNSEKVEDTTVSDKNSKEHVEFKIDNVLVILENPTKAEDVKKDTSAKQSTDDQNKYTDDTDKAEEIKDTDKNLKTQVDSKIENNLSASEENENIIIDNNDDVSESGIIQSDSNVHTKEESEQTDVNKMSNNDLKTLDKSITNNNIISTQGNGDKIVENKDSENLRKCTEDQKNKPDTNSSENLVTKSKKIVDYEKEHHITLPRDAHTQAKEDTSEKPLESEDLMTKTKSFVDYEKENYVTSPRNTKESKIEEQPSSETSKIDSKILAGAIGAVGGLIASQTNNLKTLLSSGSHSLDDAKESLSKIDDDVVEMVDNVEEALDNSVKSEFEDLKQQIDKIEDSVEDTERNVEKSIKNKIIDATKSADETLEDIEPFVEDKKNDIKEDIEDAKNEAKEIHDISQNVSANLKNLINETIPNTETDIKDTLEDVALKVEDKIVSVEETLGEMNEDLKTISDDINENISNTEDNTKDTLDNLSSTISKTEENIEDTIAQTSDKLNDKKICLKDDINDAVEDVSDKRNRLKRDINNVVDNIEEAKEDIFEKVEDVFEGVKSSVLDLAENVESNILETENDINSEIESITNDNSETKNDTTETIDEDKNIETVDKLKNNDLETLKDTSNKLEQNDSNTLHKTEITFTDTVNCDAKQNIEHLSKTISKIKNDITETTENANKTNEINDAIDNVKEAVEELPQKLEEDVTDVVGEMKDMAEEAKHHVPDNIDNLSANVSKIEDDICKQVENIQDKASEKDTIVNIAESEAEHNLQENVKGQVAKPQDKAHLEVDKNDDEAESEIENPTLVDMKKTENTLEEPVNVLKQTEDIISDLNNVTENIDNNVIKDIKEKVDIKAELQDNKETLSDEVEITTDTIKKAFFPESKEKEADAQELKGITEHNNSIAENVSKEDFLSDKVETPSDKIEEELHRINNEIKNEAEKLKHVEDQVMKDADETLEDITEHIGNVAKDVNNHVAEVGDDINDKLEKDKQDLNEIKNKLTDDINETIAKAEDAVDNSADVVYKDMEDLSDELTSKQQDSADETEKEEEENIKNNKINKTSLSEIEDDTKPEVDKQDDKKEVSVESIRVEDKEKDTYTNIEDKYDSNDIKTNIDNVATPIKIKGDTSNFENNKINTGNKSEELSEKNDQLKKNSENAATEEGVHNRIKDNLLNTENNTQSEEDLVNTEDNPEIKENDTKDSSKNNLVANAKAFVDYEKENYVSSPRDSKTISEETVLEEINTSSDSSKIGTVLAGAVGAVGGFIASQGNKIKSLLTSDEKSFKETIDSEDNLKSKEKSDSEDIKEKRGSKEKVQNLENETDSESFNIYHENKDKTNITATPDITDKSDVFKDKNKEDTDSRIIEDHKTDKTEASKTPDEQLSTTKDENVDNMKNISENSNETEDSKDNINKTVEKPTNSSDKSSENTISDTLKENTLEDTNQKENKDNLENMSKNTRESNITNKNNKKPKNKFVEDVSNNTNDIKEHMLQNVNDIEPDINNDTKEVNEDNKEILDDSTDHSKTIVEESNQQTELQDKSAQENHNENKDITELNTEETNFHKIEHIKKSEENSEKKSPHKQDKSAPTELHDKFINNKSEITVQDSREKFEEDKSDPRELHIDPIKNYIETMVQDNEMKSEEDKNHEEGESALLELQNKPINNAAGIMDQCSEEKCEDNEDHKKDTFAISELQEDLTNDDSETSITEKSNDKNIHSETKENKIDETKKRKREINTNNQSNDSGKDTSSDIADNASDQATNKSVIQIEHIDGFRDTEDNAKTINSPTLEETIKDFKDAIQSEIDDAEEVEKEADSLEHLTSLSSDHLLERLLTAKSLEDEEPPAEMSEQPIIEEPESEDEKENPHVDILIIDDNYTSPTDVIDEEDEEHDVERHTDDESEDHSESQQLIHEIKSKLDNIKAIIEEKHDNDHDEVAYNLDIVDEDHKTSSSDHHDVVIIEVTDKDEEIEDENETKDNDIEIIEIKHDHDKKDSLEAHSNIGRLISHDSSTSLDSLATVVLTEDLNKFREEKKKKDNYDHHDLKKTSSDKPKDAQDTLKKNINQGTTNQEHIENQINDETTLESRRDEPEEIIALDENANHDDVLVIDATKLSSQNEDDIKFLAGLVNAAIKIQSAFRGFRVRNLNKNQNELLLEDNNIDIESPKNLPEEINYDKENQTTVVTTKDIPKDNKEETFEKKPRNPTLGQFLKTMEKFPQNSTKPEEPEVSKDIKTLESETTNSKEDLPKNNMSPEPFYLHEPGSETHNPISEAIKLSSNSLKENDVGLLHSGEFHDSIPLSFTTNDVISENSEKFEKSLKATDQQMASDCQDANAKPPAGAERPVTSCTTASVVDVVASSPTASLSATPLPPHPDASSSAAGDSAPTSVAPTHLSHNDARGSDQGEVEGDGSASEASQASREDQNISSGNFKEKELQEKTRLQESKRLDSGEREGHVPGSTAFDEEDSEGKTAPESAKHVADMDPRRNNASVLERNAESQAATKIQASFRGYQVRKQMQKPKCGNDVISPKRNARRKTSGGRANDSKKMKDDTNIEDKSATKIQAGVRGFLVRRRNQKKRDNEEI